MINKSNYEAFALDYLEGNLSATERQAMETFLQQNPAIAAEIRSLETMVTLVPDETVVFENKNVLFKSEGGARIVAMHRRTWFRVGIAAAAMVLLIGGYLAGYFTANIENKDEMMVNTPKEQLENKEEIKQKELFVADEKMEEKAVEEMPIQQEINKKDASTKKVTKESKPTQQYNDVANVKTPKTENKTIETPSLEKNQEESVVEKEENAVAANQENHPNTPETIPQEQLTPEKEVTISTLPEKAIAINEIPAAEAMEEIVAELPQPIAMNEMNEAQKEAEAEKKSKKTLRKIGRFFGKLPFEGATASLIPTYYTDKKNKGK